MRWFGRSKPLDRVVKDPIYAPCELLLSWVLDNRWFVIIAATGRCGYALLYNPEGECQALVWLFNGPDLMDNCGWRLEPIEFPYLDPEVESPWPLTDEDFDVTDETSEEVVQVGITIKRLRHAKLIEGHDIGVNRAVKYDHPMAWSWEGNRIPPPGYSS